MESSFLQKIRENPSDDSLRLVFADWLYDHGKPDRAEFIRVQVELHQKSKSDSRTSSLREREKELLTENRTSWLGSLVNLVASPRGTGRGTSRKALDAKFSFLRGLIQVQFGPDAILSPDLLEDPQWDWVEDIRWLSGWRAANVLIILNSSRLTHIQTLALHGIMSSKRSREEIAALMASPLLARITLLDLTSNQIDAQGAGALASSHYLDGLTQLDLTFNKLGDEGMAELAASPNLSKLTSLRLRANKIGRGGAVALANSPYLTNLNCLDLSENTLGDEAVAALAASPHLPQLRILNLRLNQIGTEGATALRTSQHLGHLTSLVLRWNALNLEGADVELLRRHFGERLEL